MKKAIISVLCILGLLQCSACARKSTFTVGSDIKAGDISDFYYTRENINYNASYLRYRFYTQDGEYFFYHEARERPNDYGPTTEADISSAGTLRLSESEWEDFFSCLTGGSVRKRGENLSEGSSGPWMYLYWDKDRSVYQEFSFASGQKIVDFEEYCSLLSGK